MGVGVPLIMLCLGRSVAKGLSLMLLGYGKVYLQRHLARGCCKGVSAVV